MCGTVLNIEWRPLLAVEPALDHLCAYAEATKEAQRANIAAARAKQEGEAASAYRGRKPSFTGAPVETVRDLDGKGTGVAEIARTTGLSRQTVYRIKEDFGAALALWG